ncbi:F0F1 ATP synthase subunit A [Robiginitomaculum antarcticum]|uniref:F0F1 ATP synthase subunit A n=1 Tax=Robiginitomaculum antarcticum TaxID=437507 RepID=UPI00035F9C22|nr:F0F1 ATP synthase subunit A [Robiginitomaculum antarcticum]
MIAAGLDPIAQFELHKIQELKLGPIDISFTNSSLMMVFTVALIGLWLLLSTRKAALVPGRAQSIAEMSYEFIADMIRSTAGKDGLRFFPFVFSLFIFILFANLLGMIPFFFTTTSHIIVTFTFAMMVIGLVVVYGVWKNGFGFLKLFWPAGVPAVLKILLVTPLEIISFLSRPISLSVRLWANMFAGHILLKLFAGFMIMMVSAFGVFKGGLAALIPFSLTLALTPLEFLVAFVQAYVFALLTCVYLSDALHPGHH